MSTCRIEGKAAKRAQFLQYANGICVVRALIKTAAGLPVYVERAFGTGPSASYAAGNCASSIRPGSHLVAFGKGLVPCRHEGEHVVRLEGVDQLLHETTDHTEPAAQAA